MTGVGLILSLFHSASELDNTESAVKELEVGLGYKAGI